MTIGRSVPGLPGWSHDLDVVLLGERPSQLHGRLLGSAHGCQTLGQFFEIPEEGTR
jgi:hypothetical protein